MSKGGFKMFETKKLSNPINYPFMMVSRSRQYSRGRDSRKSYVLKKLHLVMLRCLRDHK